VTRWSGSRVILELVRFLPGGRFPTSKLVTYVRATLVCYIWQDAFS
jgi:hypothetical protein